MWRVVAEKAIMSLLKEVSSTNNTVMIKNVNLDNETEEPKFLEEIITSRRNVNSTNPPTSEEMASNEFRVAAWTLGYNFADSYAAISRYLYICRELEKAEKYKKTLGKPVSAVGCVPGLCCATRMFLMIFILK